MTHPHIVSQDPRHCPACLRPIDTIPLESPPSDDTDFARISPNMRAPDLLGVSKHYERLMYCGWQ